jgi:chromosome segregation ATPase
MNNLEDIKDKLVNLEKLIIDKFDSLEKKIDLLNKENEGIKKECTKMGSHIDFIEDTYNTLQMPLNYIKKSVERLTGSSSKDLPIKDKKPDDSEIL